jgi:heat shock protein HslJ
MNRSIASAVPVILIIAACAADPYREPPPAPIPDLAGTQWTVTSIDGRDTVRDERLTADFGVDGRVNGDSGCNNFSGPFIQNGATVRFGELLSTRRACAEANRQRQEDRMLDILRGATTARVVRDELRLRGTVGTITLVRAARIDPQNIASTSRGRVQYNCQGVPLTVEYGATTARTTWPDGTDVLELQRRSGDSDVIRYESQHSELRFGRDLVWGREGGSPRTCFEEVR